ncbi:MAG: MarR family winged helix-turn-helix transcriptional regulator [Acidimicrobiales bacterium]
MSVYRPLLEQVGITYTQYTVLLVLWERGETSMRELADALSLDSGTLSPVVKRMEHSGLVSRKRDDRDERVLQIRLTDAGEDLRLDAARIQQYVERRTGFGLEELARVRTELNDLTWRLRNDTDPLCPTVTPLQCLTQPVTCDCDLLVLSVGGRMS